MTHKEFKWLLIAYASVIAINYIFGKFTKLPLSLLSFTFSGSRIRDSHDAPAQLGVYPFLSQCRPIVPIENAR
jgi:hypothetical protein